MLVSSMLLSGNQHAKIALMMKAMGMNPMPKSFDYQVQSLYCFPVITTFRVRMLEANHENYPDRVTDYVVGKLQ